MEFRQPTTEGSVRASIMGQLVGVLLLGPGHRRLKLGPRRVGVGVHDHPKLAQLCEQRLPVLARRRDPSLRSAELSGENARLQGDPLFFQLGSPQVLGRVRRERTVSDLWRSAIGCAG